MIGFIFFPQPFKNQKRFFVCGRMNQDGLKSSGKGTIFFDEIGDIAPSLQTKLLQALEDKEIELIIKALEKHNGKRKYAAQDLGISERTLYRKIKEYNIE